MLFFVLLVCFVLYFYRSFSLLLMEHMHSTIPKYLFLHHGALIPAHPTGGLSVPMEVPQQSGPGRARPSRSGGKQEAFALGWHSRMLQLGWLEICGRTGAVHSISFSVNTVAQTIWPQLLIYCQILRTNQNVWNKQEYFSLSLLLWKIVSAAEIGYDPDLIRGVACLLKICMYFHLPILKPWILLFVTLVVYWLHKSFFVCSLMGIVYFHVHMFVSFIYLYNHQESSS